MRIFRCNCAGNNHYSSIEMPEMGQGELPVLERQQVDTSILARLSAAKERALTCMFGPADQRTKLTIGIKVVPWVVFGVGAVVALTVTFHRWSSLHASHTGSPPSGPSFSVLPTNSS